MKRFRGILVILTVLSVVVPLIAALKDESHGVKKNAALALKNITGKDFGKDPALWQAWWEKNK